MKRRLFLGLLFLLLFSSIVTAVGGNTEGFLSHANGISFLKIAALLLVLITLIAIPFKNHLNKFTKILLFWLVTIPVVLATLYFSATIVYENSLSVTKGPVHWHMDYQVWVCGERIDLVNPTFPKNKIGSPLFHEHNDDRIHVEGTVMNLEDINLGAYFKVIGGELSDGHLIYESVYGIVDVKNGDNCNGQPAILKVYVNGKKEENYWNYQYYPDAYVPPGDCTIIIFDETDSDNTDIICESWISQDWSYQGFHSGELKRREITIGDTTWQ